MLALKRGTSGFSLVELLIVVAMAAILLAVAAPNLIDTVRRHQLNATVSDLAGAINLTRAQAIMRGRRVVLVPLGAGGDDWRTGWIVFIDQDNDRRPGPTEEVVSSHGPIPDGIAVGFNFTSNKTPYYIAYNGSGRSCSDTGSMAARWGTLSLFQGDQTRRIKISMLGRLRVCDPQRDIGECEGEDAMP